MRLQPSIRAGFTVIEMLVVAGIILLVAAMVVAVVPSSSSRASIRAADQLQGWLMIAKQKAYRDRAPRGLRLLPSAEGGGLITEMQFLEQPDDFKEGQAVITGMPGNFRNVAIQTFPGGVAIPVTDIVQPGDFFHIVDEANRPTSGHYIQAVAGNNLTLVSSVNIGAPLTTTTYAISRAYRPMIGEPSQLLPRNICIDANVSALPPPNGDTYDIMFGPTGQLVTSTQGRVIFWIRDYTLTNNPTDFSRAGEQALICIYARTGVIAPAAISQSGDPFAFTRDGQANGL